ncbi:hypothetical protein Glove_67g39 [Diversispora epigaea]|uniref:Uncharacterized protein n=1 Tax=Diversispora epigaea TaxID=1348612 RepID=A0A397JAD6_9GLOM|nr:hypothetical protein Glove_67g39 [Diversispora epigaea]
MSLRITYITYIPNYSGNLNFDYSNLLVDQRGKVASIFTVLGAEIEALKLINTTTITTTTPLNYQTHPQAIYTSQPLNYPNLPKNKNYERELEELTKSMSCLCPGDSGIIDLDIYLIFKYI